MIYFFISTGKPFDVDALCCQINVISLPNATGTVYSGIVRVEFNDPQRVDQATGRLSQ
jgi:hypothetical protein